MKAIKIVFIILSVLMFLFQVMAYLSLLSGQADTDLSSPPVFVGFNFFFFLSVLFAFLAWRWDRKIRKKRAEALLGLLADDISGTHETKIR